MPELEFETLKQSMERWRPFLEEQRKQMYTTEHGRVMRADLYVDRALSDLVNQAKKRYAKRFENFFKGSLPRWGDRLAFCINRGLITQESVNQAIEEHAARYGCRPATEQDIQQAIDRMETMKEQLKSTKENKNEAAS